VLNNKNIFPLLLLIGQIISMLSIIFMMYYGTWWEWMITGIVYCCIMTGITVGYHRLLSHKAFGCPLWIRILLLFFASIPFYGPAIVWVANHREHHRFSDTENDPHSPYYRGILYSYFLQVFSPINFKYARDLLKQNIYRLQVKYYWYIIAIYFILLYIIDPFAVVYAYLAPAGFSKLIGGLVFTYSHRKNKPHNDTWVGLLTLGEGFHLNHHNNASMHRWHKLDIGGALIELIDKTKKSKL
jgi:stearoyl-CoA desaturase (Delta-9 desaturase)